MQPPERKTGTASDSVTGSEIAQLVELLAEQLSDAVDEAFEDIDSLSRSVLDAARYADVLIDAVGAHAGGETGSTAAGSSELKSAVQLASARLQFADRLVQRLGNVVKNLKSMALFLKSVDRPISGFTLEEILDTVRGTFTMEQERKMFDAKFASSIACVDVDHAARLPEEPVLFDTD